MFSLYALFSVLTIVMMTYSFLVTTLILVGALKRFQYKYDVPYLVGRSGSERSQVGETLDVAEFSLFWQSTCEKDWQRAYAAFSLGMPMFLISIIFGVWVKFLPLLGPGIAVSSVCSFTVFLLLKLHFKWATFLSKRREEQQQ